MAYSVQMAVECVIAPESIDITIDDIGGLDKIVKKLVRLAFSTGVNFVDAHIRQGACGHGLIVCLPAFDTIE